MALSGGSPPNGIYSGTGVSGNSFDPSSSGDGTFQLIYVYTDTNGCSNQDVDTVHVLICSVE